MKPRLKVKEVKENTFEIIEMEEKLRNTDLTSSLYHGRVLDVRIYSGSQPEFETFEFLTRPPILYLRGTNIEKDNDLLHIPPSDRDRFIKAVRAFGGAVKTLGGLWFTPTGVPIEIARVVKTTPESPLDDEITGIEAEIRAHRANKELLAKKVRDAVLRLKAAKAARASWRDVMAKKGKSK